MLIDLRGRQPAQRLPSILPLYNELPGGRGLILISDGNERAILEFFQKTHPGDFEWHELEEGPLEWRIVLSKRGAGLPRRRQVMEFMEADHRRMAEMLGSVKAAADRGVREQTARLIGHLITGMRKHIQIEEELLLPVIAERLASPRGPAAFLREEHVAILGAVESLRERAESCETGAEELKRAIDALSPRLQDHVAIEERILYAVTDLLLSEAERDELVRRCQQL